MMANLVDINDTSHVKPFINWREWRSKQCYLYKTSHSKFYPNERTFIHVLLLDNKIFTDAYDVNSITDQYLINISIYQHNNPCMYKYNSAYVVINALNLFDRLESILFFVENVCLMCDESCLETYLI